MRLGQAIFDVYRTTRALVRPAGGALAALVLVSACWSPSDHPQEKTGEAASAILPGSTFEGDDGNLIVNTAGNIDWCADQPPNQPAVCQTTVPGFKEGFDLPAGKTDNSFGQGTKEDDPNVTIVTGSIPPNKNDLDRFLFGTDVATSGPNIGHEFLYLGWERLVNIGNANLDFEINQVDQTQTPPGFTSGATGPLTLVRTAGDLLVTYDFSGSGTPTLGLLTWLTSATTPPPPGGPGSVNTCFSSNTFPCWGNRVNLSAAGFAEGAVNTVSVTDPIGQGAPRTLTTGLFGEAAIDLTAAGVFPPGQCEAFGSVFVKSRSSSSFGAELKDFIAPTQIHLSNCGQIIIKKVTVPSPDTTNTTFSYTTTGGLNPATFTLQNGGTQDYGSTLFPKTYTVTEADPGPNFTLTSLVCTKSNGSTFTTDTTTRTATINLAAGDTVTCTYTNTRQLGAIKITKTSSKAAATPLAGATFSITLGGTPIAGSPFTTGSDGTVCVPGLAFDTYSVTETGAPSGYRIDNPNPVSVTVDHNASCTSGTPNAPPTFTDTPLTDITVTAHSEAIGGTRSTISCTPAIGNSPQGPAENPSVSATGLTPGDYTCTVHVDP